MSTGAAPQKVRVDVSQEILLPDGTPAIFSSEVSRKLVSMTRRIAPSPTAVLITGETGVGKEVVARAIHHFSLRHNNPLVDFNCAAIPEHLIESELFGYEKGAFSGADHTKQGFFEMADGGTLFLDEVGELDARVQVKLLRVLDGVPYYRLGGTKKVSVNVRIIAATNRDLEQEVANGKFRRDLFHRLSQIQLRVPALRERKEEIPQLAAYYLSQHKPGARLSEEALFALRSYSWPGNVRELRNIMANAGVMSDADDLVIDVEHLPMELVQTTQGVTSEAPDGFSRAPASGGDLEAMERRMIFDALKRHDNDQARAAEQLGISRRTLTRKLKAYQTPQSPAEDAYIGRVGPRSQKYFRANIAVDALVICGAERQVVQTVNVSRNGIGVAGLTMSISPDAEFTIEFRLPSSDVLVRANGAMSWMDADARAGISFTSVENRAELESWIYTQLRADGWQPYNVAT